MSGSSGCHTDVMDADKLRALGFTKVRFTNASGSPSIRLFEDTSTSTYTQMTADTWYNIPSASQFRIGWYSVGSTRRVSRLEFG